MEEIYFWKGAIYYEEKIKQGRGIARKMPKIYLAIWSAYGDRYLMRSSYSSKYSAAAGTADSVCAGKQ